jgi:hypothetical protein
LSVVVGERSGNQRAKHLLNVQGSLTYQIRDDGPLLRTLIRCLGVLATPTPPHAITTRAFLVIRADGSGLVVDHRLAGTLERIEPYLRRAACKIVRLPWLALDRTSGEALLPDSAGFLHVDVPGLDRTWPPVAGADDLRAGRVGVNALAFFAPEPPASESSVTASLVALVARPDHTVATEDVRHMRDIATKLDAVGLGHSDASLLRVLATG